MKIPPEHTTSLARLTQTKRPTITVGQFYRDHADDLHMSLVGPERGFDRKILEPTINRPGLALSGFFQVFCG